MSKFYSDQKFQTFENSVCGLFHPFCCFNSSPRHILPDILKKTSIRRRPMKLGVLIPYGLALWSFGFHSKFREKNFPPPLQIRIFLSSYSLIFFKLLFVVAQWNLVCLFLIFWHCDVLIFLQNFGKKTFPPSRRRRLSNIFSVSPDTSRSSWGLII